MTIRRAMLPAVLPLALLALVVVAGSQPPATAQGKKLVVWWNKGYYPEEDDAMIKIAKSFGASHGVDVELSFTAQEDLLKKIISALIARRVPDVAFCFYNDWEVVPKFGWEDRLADVSDVVADYRPRYFEKFLAVANIWNNTEKKRSFYGVPVEAQTMHIHYWRDLVREAGLPDDPAKIPLKWDAYWGFWRRAQDALRKKDPAKYRNVFGIGMTESTRATDTLYDFEMALLSFGGQILSDDGKIVADQPKDRAAIVRTLAWFGELFKSGYVPPDALNWTDGDNNAGFHAHSLVMTPNPSLSIPAKEFFTNRDNYFTRTATVEWPDGPDGRKPTYLVAVKTIIVPKDSPNQALAKEFIRYVLEPPRLLEYIKAANGRWFPAFTDLAKDPFFRTGHSQGVERDYHIPVAARIFLDRQTKVFDHARHPAYSQVYAENVYGKAMARIIVDKWTPEQATDEAFGRIKTIFAQYR